MSTPTAPLSVRQFTDLAVQRPVLELRELKVWFPTDGEPIRAVDGVSLSISAGETLAIVGESGSGKSVTGMSIMRLAERDGALIAGGSIVLNRPDGSSVDLGACSQASMQAIRGREIAMVFQDPMSCLNPVQPIGEQIGEALRVHRHASRAVARAAAIDLIARVGIPDPQRHVDAYPHQLSGGMRQRVMLAAALACEPALLIADEPTTALDVTVQAQIIALLADLQREGRMAMIFISHDLHLVRDIADRIVVMYANQVVESGPAGALLERPAHPYTRALLDCVPRGGQVGELAPNEDFRRMNPIPGRMPRPDAVLPGCRFHARCRWAQPACEQAPIDLAVLADDASRASRCLRWRQVIGSEAVIG